jgi:hypothetical protein
LPRVDRSSFQGFFRQTPPRSGDDASRFRNARVLSNLCADGIQLATFVTMAKQSSTNSSFFKTGGREAGSHETMAHGQKPLRNHVHGAKLQGKQGQENFIPGEAPVGQTRRSKSVKKK